MHLVIFALFYIAGLHAQQMLKCEVSQNVVRMVLLGKDATHRDVVHVSFWFGYGLREYICF